MLCPAYPTKTPGCSYFLQRIRFNALAYNNPEVESAISALQALTILSAVVVGYNPTSDPSRGRSSQSGPGSDFNWADVTHHTRWRARLARAAYRAWPRSALSSYRTRWLMGERAGTRTG